MIARALIAVAVTSLVAGCIPLPAKYYFPVADSGVREHSSLCTAPGAQYRYEIGKGVTGLVSAIHEERSTELWLSFDLNHGSTLQLADDVLMLNLLDGSRAVSIPLSRFMVPAWSPDRKAGVAEYYAPTDKFSGNSRRDPTQPDRFSVTMRLPYAPQQFSIVVPTARVNGQHIPSKEIRFTLKEVLTVAALCSH